MVYDGNDKERNEKKKKGLMKFMKCYKAYEGMMVGWAVNFVFFFKKISYFFGTLFLIFVFIFINFLLFFWSS